MRRFLALAALAAAVALALAGVSSGKLYVKCVPNKSPGTEVVKQRIVQIFCGTAKATLRQSGVTYRFTNGMCLRNPNGLIVGLGRLTHLRPDKPALYKAFYLASSAIKDGTFKNVTARYQLPGKQIVFKGTFVLQAKRTRGTFKARVLREDKPGLGPAVSGSFTCK